MLSTIFFHLLVSSYYQVSSPFISWCKEFWKPVKKRGHPVPHCAQSVSNGALIHTLSSWQAVFCFWNSCCCSIKLEWKGSLWSLFNPIFDWKVLWIKCNFSCFQAWLDRKWHLLSTHGKKARGSDDTGMNKKVLTTNFFLLWPRYHDDRKTFLLHHCYIKAMWRSTRWFFAACGRWLWRIASTSRSLWRRNESKFSNQSGQPFTHSCVT